MYAGCFMECAKYLNFDVTGNGNNPAGSLRKTYFGLVNECFTGAD